MLFYDTIRNHNDGFRGKEALIRWKRFQWLPCRLGVNEINSWSLLTIKRVIRGVDLRSLRLSLWQTPSLFLFETEWCNGRVWGKDCWKFDKRVHCIIFKQLFKWRIGKNVGSYYIWNGDDYNADGRGNIYYRRNKLVVTNGVQLDKINE